MIKEAVLYYASPAFTVMIFFIDSWSIYRVKILATVISLDFMYFLLKNSLFGQLVKRNL